ncbi:hypothetical protein LRR81_00695 [Metabacillus sp. GX 13764]|uniref:hypothetical protein n=1 Tax=Metabacillus kandeliae TaxID=2900151 RepID=UPI001E2BD549|nr:hypothetical protein [Metabacillus kandeliae]MCD7032727.1 hypothetical protein [Metabacillus kandeliae]
MSNETTEDFYTLLKKIGFQLEGQMNQFIQDSLNKEDVIKIANAGGIVLARLLEGLQEFIEEMSIPLNFPTKNDVARIGKLVIQSEDKLDLIEEELFEILSILKGNPVAEGISKAVGSRRNKMFSNAENKQQQERSDLRNQLLASANSLGGGNADDPMYGMLIGKILEKRGM